MMMMRNKNRLIKDFQKQTKTTIWKHMEAMAVNYAVYSNRLKGFAPFMNDDDVYFYCDSTNMVIVCIDCYDNFYDRTCVESVDMEPIVYHPGCEPHEGRVWKLKETMQIVKERLRKQHIVLNVYGVMLTEAKIANAEELELVWEFNDMKVIDGFLSLRHRKAGVNNDEDLRGKIYFDAAVNEEDDGEEEEEKTCKEVKFDDTEFERMMTDFINREYEEEMNKQGETPTDDDPAPEEPEEDTSENSGNDVDDTVISQGEIEQNLNLSVKVEILRPFANPREELDKLVGCEDIKRRMDELVALTDYNKMMSELFPDSKQHQVSLHSVFLGRPGTGKTTVCKIYGSLLRKAGALSKGHVVVCDRGTFIGTLWGDEERSMRQVLELAKGGVLMIDEAYLLNGKHESDPGKLVIQLLMNILADETQRDIAVVLCGYKEPMLKLLSTNPGLQSRFPNKFEFSDFTVDELLEITRRRVREYQYEFTQLAWEKYNHLLSTAYQQRDPQTWGNARFIANQLERIYIQHATRCVRQRPADKSQMRLLTPDDILPIEVPKERRHIGF